MPSDEAMNSHSTQLAGSRSETRQAAVQRSGSREAEKDGKMRWNAEQLERDLTVSIATTVRRIVAEAEMLPRLVALIAAFVVFSVESGLSQWYVATLHVSPATAAGQAALVFRVAMPVAIDLASMLYLSIMKVKSLKRYLAEMAQKAEAIEQANLSHLRVEQARA